MKRPLLYVELFVDHISAHIHSNGNVESSAIPTSLARILVTDHEETRANVPSKESLLETK